MCVNTEFRNWAHDVCLDMCKYPIDGIFFDGPATFMDCCYCLACKELYQQEYGRKMPPKHPGHPELKQLADFQAQSILRFYEHSNKAIKAVRPDVALYGNCGTREEPYYALGRNNRTICQGQDVLLAEGGFNYDQLSNLPPWKAGCNAKYYQTQSGGKPTIIAASPAHGPWRSYYQTKTELKLTAAQSVVNGSGVGFGCFAWFHQEPAFESISKYYKFFKEHSEYFFNTSSCARVAIIWPEDSVNFYAKPQILHGDFTQGGQKGEAVGDIQAEFNGFYDAMIKNHFPCDVIDEESVRRGEISKYDLLLLPNVTCTDDLFDEQLRSYVKNGGNVMASFETSICDEVGVRNQDLSLHDLFGISMQRTPLKPFAHFYFFRQNAPPFDSITPTLLPAPQINCEIALDGATMISPYSIKFEGWDGSEILPSEFPAITTNTFGRGKAVYLAGVFGAHYWMYKQMDIRLLMRNFFGILSSSDVELENAPTSVELIHRENADKSREMVSLINYAGGLTRPFEEITPQKDIKIKLHTKFNVARALRSDQTLSTKRDGQWLCCTLPELNIFETIVFE